MLYTSPFELLNLPMADLQQLDKKMLQLKKKQWLAELQLQDGHTLTIGGRELTKHDIVQLFEQLEQTDALAMHAAIAADPALLQFLQTGKINPGQKFSYNPFYQDPAFIAFVSPFYREVFNRHVLKALAGSDYARIEGVFGNPLLLTGSDYDDCLGRLRGYLDEKLHEVALLRGSLANNRRADMGDLHSYYIYDWINTLNKLPDDFMAFREDYAIELYNLAVDLWNGKRRDEARSLLYGIQSLRTPPHIRQMINDLVETTSRVAERTGSSGGSGGGANIAWVVLSLLFIIFRAGSTCNNNSSNRPYDISYITKNYRERPMRVGFVAFQPTTQRDSDFVAFLNTLHQSATTNDQDKGKTLANGDDPYKALLANGIFKPVTSKVATSSEKPAEAPPPATNGATVEENVPKVVPDRSVESIYEENEEGVTAPVEDAPSIVVEDGKPGKALVFTPIDIYNRSNYGCIVFFYSAQTIKSVYVGPNSTYQIQLPKGQFWAFCYAGNHFKPGLALSMDSKVSLKARKAFAGMARFAEIPQTMLPYLLPANNLHFWTGNPNTSIETTASITIDLKEKPCFDMQSGKGVTAHRTIVPSTTY
jgi:hypothetical protein